MPAADVYRALWRQRVMILLLTVVAGVAAYLYTRTQPTIYQAGALVRIQQRAPSTTETFGNLGSLELGERLARTYAEIVKTNSMKERVADLLGENVPGDAYSISASPVGDVELLSVTARSEEPRVAARAANATTIALRDFIRETGTLRDQIVVVDDAGTPGAPILPRAKFTIALAILVALLFNGALALGREFFADRLPNVDEWHERFGKPVLATIPTLGLLPFSKAVPSTPELTDDSSPTALTTQAMSGPTRWSLDEPGVRVSGT
jgi:capsular polysaccharide biosynthesis protein